MRPLPRADQVLPCCGCPSPPCPLHKVCPPYVPAPAASPKFCSHRVAHLNRPQIAWCEFSVDTCVPTRQFSSKFLEAGPHGSSSHCGASASTQQALCRCVRESRGGVEAATVHGPVACVCVCVCRGRGEGGLEKLLEPSSLRQRCRWWSVLWYFCQADKTGWDITVWKNTLPPSWAPCEQVVSMMNTTVGDSAPAHPNLKRMPHLAVLCRQLGGLETSPWVS